MDNRDLLQSLKNISERLEELEKPPEKMTFSNSIALIGLIITIIAGFSSVMFIGVSKVTTLELRLQNTYEEMIELKNEIREIKNNDTQRRSNN